MVVKGFKSKNGKCEIASPNIIKYLRLARSRPKGHCTLVVYRSAYSVSEGDTLLTALTVLTVLAA